jgi:Iron-containing redox enzyme
MMLPKPRGAFSADVFEVLRSDPSRLVAEQLPEAENREDTAVVLWSLYELSFRGFEDVEEDLEWHPSALRLRGDLERDLEARLRERWTGHQPDEDFADAFFAFLADHDGPSLARFVQTEATEEQVLDLLRMRSIYHLKEADPSAWVVPRLDTASKAGLVELLYDEYGAGDPNRLHHHLFARGLEAVGLRAEYGAYVDDAPAEVLEQNNAMALFGLHRRLRGAAMGHLAAFEATSSMPSRRMAAGLERLGLDATMVGYYTEHVTADAAHEQVAVRAICASLLDREPSLWDDVFFGAFTCLDQEARVAGLLLDRWKEAS